MDVPKLLEAMCMFLAQRHFAPDYGKFTFCDYVCADRKEAERNSYEEANEKVDESIIPLSFVDLSLLANFLGL